jgi:predicted small lipoprotein YifL
MPPGDVHLMRALRTGLIAAGAALLVFACGQKGPLYLPDKGAAVVTAPAAAQQRPPAPAASPPAPAPATPAAPAQPKPQDKDKDQDPAPKP